MKLIKNSKKAMAVQSLVGIVIVLLSVYLTSDFLFSTSKISTTNAEDIKCNQFISLKDNTAVKAYDFVNGLNFQCKKEIVENKGETDKEIFEEIAKSMSKCWYRYGEGEKDFLGNVGNDGNWCFTCAKMSFENEDKVFSYSKEFIPWTQENKIQLANKSKIYYSEYLNLKYFDGEINELAEVVEGINDINKLTESSDSAMKPFLLELSKENQNLFDLAQKEINTNEELYIVYRYDRVPKETWELIGSIGLGVAAGIGTEALLETGATMGFGALVAMPKAAYKGGKLLLTIGKYSEMLKTILLKMGKVVKFTKKLKIDTIVDLSFSTITKMKAMIPKLAQFDLALSKKFGTLTSKLEELGFKSIDEISETIVKNEAQLKKLQETTMKAIDDDLLNSKAIKKLAASESKYLDEIAELRKLEDELRAMDNLDEVTRVQKIKKYLKRTTRLVSAATGGSVAGEINTKSNQFVDVMNKEQYYRNCGTETISE